MTSATVKMSPDCPEETLCVNDVEKLVLKRKIPDFCDSI